MLHIWHHYPPPSQSPHNHTLRPDCFPWPFSVSFLVSCPLPSLPSHVLSYVLLWHLEIRHQGDLEVQELPCLDESWWLLYPRLTLHLKPTCSLLVTLEGQALCTSVHASSGDSWSPINLVCKCAWAVTKLVTSNSYRYTRQGIQNDHLLMTNWWKQHQGKTILTSVKQLVHQNWLFSKRAMILGDEAGGKKGKGKMI